MNRRTDVVLAVASLFGPLGVCSSAAPGVPAVPASAAVERDEPIRIPPDQAARVGRKVWMNETGGKPDAITFWSDGEDFASLGIGHFLWFAGRPEPFEESFPRMIEFLQGMKGRLPSPIPEWLDKRPVPPCPWKDRRDFEKDFRSPKMVELRTFLTDTFGPQAQFLALRLQETLPKILATLDDPRDRARVRAQFYRVARSSKDLYPLIDYVNFKGEGVKPSETYPNPDTGVPEGWGLKQVLQEMRGTDEGRPALDEFSVAAQTVLKRRIRNHPPNARWEANWLARCASYRER